MPDCSGPGRNKATSAMRSSNESGRNRLINSFIPLDSNWNTAVVCAACMRSKVFLSSNGIAVISSPGIEASPVKRLMSLTAQSIIVKVRRPRKSNFTKPMLSTSPISNWVTTD